MSTTAEPTVRDARDDDAAGLIELIGTIWATYPGIVFDIDGELPELRAIATSFKAGRGRFWVAENAGRIVGSVGLVPAAEAGARELRKLYVAADLRRRGLASRLLVLAEGEAKARGADVLELWTDSRFHEAHAFYARAGYRRLPEERALNDLSNSIEYRFTKQL